MASLMRILFLLALLIEQVHGQITFLPIGEECNQTAVIEMMTSVKFVEDSPSLYPFVDASLCVVPDQPLANVTVTLSPFDDKIEMISFDQNLLIELQGNANDTKVWSVLSDDPTNITRALLSLSYENFISNDSIGDISNRSILINWILGNDTLISALAIQFIAKNDPPTLNFGSGIDRGMVLKLTEGEMFITRGQPIITEPHLLEFNDEEMNDLRSIEIVLVSSFIDANESIFLMSRDLQATSSNKTLIFYEEMSLFENRYDSYSELLKSIYYINFNEEPTVLDNDGEQLDRKILITVTDTGSASSTNTITINITTVNDNRPVLFVVNETKACVNSISSRKSSAEAAPLESQNSRDRFISQPSEVADTNQNQLGVLLIPSILVPTIVVTVLTIALLVYCIVRCCRSRKNSSTQALKYEVPNSSVASKRYLVEPQNQFNSHSENVESLYVSKTGEPERNRKSQNGIKSKGKQKNPVTLSSLASSPQSNLFLPPTTQLPNDNKMHSQEATENGFSRQSPSVVVGQASPSTRSDSLAPSRVISAQSDQLTVVDHFQPKNNTGSNKYSKHSQIRHCKAKPKF